MPHHLAAAPNVSESFQTVMEGSGLKTNHVLVVLGAGFAVAALIFATIYLLKRGAKEEAERPRAPAPEPRSETGEGTDHRRRRRKRRRRREHRPRNPSLQQTGGLPPPRPEDQPPAF